MLTMADPQIQPERASQAEVALQAALRGASQRQRAIARACPEVLRRLAHLSAAQCLRDEVAEDIAADAIPRVSRRLQRLAGPQRFAAVEQFFDTNNSALLPLCTAIALALQGAPTDLRTVAERIRRMLDEGPESLIARFGPTAYCWKASDSVERILKRLQEGPRRRRLPPRRCEPASTAEVEALALLWDTYRPAPGSQYSRLRFDVGVGTTFRGLNLRERTCAVIHIDEPWAPATIKKRNARPRPPR